MGSRLKGRKPKSKSKAKLKLLKGFRRVHEKHRGIPSRKQGPKVKGKSFDRAASVFAGTTSPREVVDAAIPNCLTVLESEGFHEAALFVIRETNFDLLNVNITMIDAASRTMLIALLRKYAEESEVEGMLLVSETWRVLDMKEIQAIRDGDLDSRKAKSGIDSLALEAEWRDGRRSMVVINFSRTYPDMIEVDEKGKPKGDVKPKVLVHDEREYLDDLEGWMGGTLANIFGVPKGEVQH